MISRHRKVKTIMDGEGFISVKEFENNKHNYE